MKASTPELSALFESFTKAVYKACKSINDWLEKLHNKESNPILVMKKGKPQMIIIVINRKM